MSSPETIFRYGYDWPATAHPIQIEMQCIRLGVGNHRSFHYEQMRKILWPQLDDHRWHQLCRDEIFRDNATVTVLMGCASSGKTHEASCAYLCQYFCFPHETCVLVTSTDMRGLRLRVWGEITMLWEQAIKVYPKLPGHLLESRVAITTDTMPDGEDDEKAVRDMRKGIIGIPTILGGHYVGIGKFSGIKQKRVRLIADESSMMGSTFLSAFANLDKNEDFQAVVLGNPNDILDPLGRAAEPREGWAEEFLEPGKTKVWDTRFMRGRCVNLIGTDSPNFDYPEGEPTRYKYLISREKIANTLSFFPKDSAEYYSQCIGSMKIATVARRVLTRAMCKKFNALEDVVWSGLGTTTIGALDAAYGGDRSVCGHADFGLDVDGKQILKFYPPVIVPIKVSSRREPMEAEDQIAKFVKDYCAENGIPPENFYHDSTGRGSLGTALAREWSSKCNPVEFGGPATKRPVTSDWFLIDPVTRERRLKTCYEHYVKFVTELWFSVRYAVEAGQIRGLPEEVMEEFCMREWNKAKDDKKELETKEEMKERVSRSPDLADWAAIIVEGARRRGFQIKSLSNSDHSDSGAYNWLKDMAKGRDKWVRSKQLARR